MNSAIKFEFALLFCIGFNGERGVLQETISRIGPGLELLGLRNDGGLKAALQSRSDNHV